MHKTISVTLAGLVFHVEEPAYKKLDAYLTSVKQRFASYQGKDEIIADIESRFAEQFTGKVNKNKNVITEAEVDEVIKKMGMVDEMDEFTETPESSDKTAREDTRLIKRLYRNPDDQILGGVASGLAAYFGIDPVIVRIAFVLLTFAWGTSIAIYILLWLIMPEAKTPSQKYEMRGQPMTLKEIEETVKKAIPENTAESVRSGAKRSASLAGRFIRKFFEILGKIVKVILKIVAGITGSAFIIAGIAALVGFTVLFFTLLVNPTASYIDFPLAELVYGTPEYYVILVTGFVGVAVPLAFLVAGGMAMLKRKKTLRTGVSVGLIAAWVVAIAIGSAFFGKVWPTYKQNYDDLLAQQANNEKVFDVTNFNQIELGGGHEITITRADEVSVKAFGTHRELEKLDLEVTNNTLKKPGFGDSWDGRICIFCFVKPPRIEITVPELAAVNLSGAVKVDADSFSAEQFMIKLSGASRYNGELAVSSFTVELSGASNLNLTSTASSTAEIKLSGASKLTFNGGEIGRLEMKLSGASQATVTGNIGDHLFAELSGASRLLAEDFPFESAQIYSSGSSKAEVDVSRLLEVSASGASDILYRGTPQETDFNTSGSSNVRQIR